MVRKKRVSCVFDRIFMMLVGKIVFLVRMHVVGMAEMILLVLRILSRFLFNRTDVDLIIEGIVAGRSIMPSGRWYKIELKKITGGGGKASSYFKTKV